MLKSLQERFEEFFAAQNDLPIESVAQYRWNDREGYRLPLISAKYTYFKEAFRQGGECHEA